SHPKQRGERHASPPPLIAWHVGAGWWSRDTARRSDAGEPTRGSGRSGCAYVAPQLPTRVCDSSYPHLVDGLPALYPHASGNGAVAVHVERLPVLWFRAENMRMQGDRLVEFSGCDFQEFAHLSLSI